MTEDDLKWRSDQLILFAKNDSPDTAKMFDEYAKNADFTAGNLNLFELRVLRNLFEYATGLDGNKTKTSDFLAVIDAAFSEYEMTIGE